MPNKWDRRREKQRRMMIERGIRRKFINRRRIHFGVNAKIAINGRDLPEFRDFIDEKIFRESIKRIGEDLRRAEEAWVISIIEKGGN